MKNSSAVCKIGTRASNLALVQARKTLAEFRLRLPGWRGELVPFDSPGDRDRETDLRTSPADFFTRDLDEAVLQGELDAAVHSAKDVPDPVAPGLDWCWLPWRDDPRDALVVAPGTSLENLPPQPRIGVSSDRRLDYCRRHFPDGRLLPIRGNIEHRLAQLDAGDFDLLLMAAAALHRLDLPERISRYIPLADLPVPEGQGTLCLTFRAGDARFLPLRSLFVKSAVFAGAGVGTADQVTRAVATALDTCDICFHDTLIPAGVLELVSPKARIVGVGKRSGRHSADQQDINRMLADACRKGCRVVRLKGGDPAIFGRLAEELDTLDALALPYRILPGISALNAVAPAAGILLTERGTSNGFAVLTPRQAGGGVTGMGKDARARFPVVAYMAVKACDRVCADLLADGWSPDTPAAMLFGAGDPAGFAVRDSLAHLPERVERAGTSLPGLLVVGDVAGRNPLRHGALGGRRVLLTCSESLQAKAAQAVHDFGGSPVSFPLIRLRPTGDIQDAVRRLESFAWLVVTSPSSARCLLAALDALRIDRRRLPALAVCGSGTAEVFAAAGLFPRLVPPAEFGAEAMTDLLVRNLPAGSEILRLRSDKAEDKLAEQLRMNGYPTTDCIAYRNEPTTATELPEHDDIVFASASAVEVFGRKWGAERLGRQPVACIGQPTRQALRALGVEPAAVGFEATIPGCIEALAAYHVNCAPVQPAGCQETSP